MTEQEARRKALKERIHEIIFEADTLEGKAFDVALLVAILVSVVVVMYDSVQYYHFHYRRLLYTLEWVLTVFFTIEYVLRLYCVKNKRKYALSFYGIIDLLAILPTYLSFFILGAQSLLVIRALRLLRIFRIFKLTNYMRQGRQISIAMRKSAPKILVFIMFVLLLVVIFGSAMYLIEGGANSGFENIPRSVYWAIVTLTTVGYGDIAPVTEVGQMMAAAIMLLGYAVIAVPTGIVTVEMARATRRRESTQVCRNCSKEGHEEGALYCNICGHSL